MKLLMRSLSLKPAKTRLPPFAKTRSANKHGVRKNAFERWLLANSAHALRSWSPAYGSAEDKYFIQTYLDFFALISET